MGGVGSGRPPLALGGKRFGRLIAVARVGTGTGMQKSALWCCVCDCGGELVVSAVRLVRAPNRDCGCSMTGRIRRTARTVESPTLRAKYACWSSMWIRCTWSGHKDWRHYGGRGIAVCDRWADFAAFLADMGDRPSPRHSLDRIDVNGNYEPGNVRWATPDVQANNRRPREKKFGQTTERPCEPEAPRDARPEGNRHDAAKGCDT